MPLLFALLLFAPDGSLLEVRNQIVAAYQLSLDALKRGDAEAALRIDTEDWVSITPGKPQLSRRERDACVRQNIAGQKPPADGTAVWKPDYEHNGTRRRRLDRVAPARQLDPDATGLETQPARKADPQRTVSGWKSSPGMTLD